MSDFYKYPTDEELSRVHDYGLSDKFGNLPEFIQFLKSIWWSPEGGFEYTQEIGCLELHTGGWSGNESIIRALDGTWFWYWYWYKSIRGGHYWFKLYQFNEDGTRRKNPRIELR